MNECVALIATPRTSALIALVFLLLGSAGAAQAAGITDLFVRAPAALPAFAQIGHDARIVDHSAWQRWLDRYLDAHHASGINRVRYAQVDARGRADLGAYIDALSAIDPRPLSRDEQMAYWINLYNAVTVRTVLAHPEVKSIRDIRSGLFSAGPWKLSAVRVAGQSLSLDDIEHGILRPVFKDRRVHYAVNCASLGCPNLSAEAYRGDRIGAQLDAAERGYLAHPRGAHMDGNTLVLSSIFDWFGSDFAANEAGVVRYVAEHAPAPLSQQLRAFHGAVRFDYDWTLNRP